MTWINHKLSFIALGFSCFLVLGVSGLVHPDTLQTVQADSSRTPLLVINHLGSSRELQRPPVRFNHDQHTRALNTRTPKDCAACHLVRDSDKQAAATKVDSYHFPKQDFDRSNKSEIMNAYHSACASCHQAMTKDGKKSGPLIGLCGKCHVRAIGVEDTKWSLSPIFNYAQHAKHVEKVSQNKKVRNHNIAGKVEIIGDLREPSSNCHLCHHSYDEKTKKIFYKKDTENSCGSCHKSQDKDKVRSLRNVIHAACIGCHTQANIEDRKSITDAAALLIKVDGKKNLAPVECGGCHKSLDVPVPTEIAKVPRLIRSQKDFMALSIDCRDPSASPSAGKSRMKSVHFNHKSHEPRAQFCSSCHHHSLEACQNCHSTTGDSRKGGGISYERAFHMATSKVACIGCHQVTKSSAKCSGCHDAMPERGLNQSTCAVCHNGLPEGKPVEMPDLPVVFDKEKVPERILVKTIEREFKPAEFPHGKIVGSLTRISNESPLAKSFHASRGLDSICSGCHHNSEPAAAQSKKVPACVSCHTKSFDQADLGRPGLMAAYHRQCIGCHEAMKQKPRSMECEKCHQPKANSLQTARQALKMDSVGLK